MREDLIAREAEQQETSQPVLPPLPPFAASDGSQPQLPPGIQAQVFRADDIGFHNPIAVRIALLVALVGFVGLQFLGLVPGGVLLYLPMLLFVGVAGVFFYRRRTGVILQPMSGARMGWLTGLFVFLILLVITAVSTAALIASKVTISEVLKKAMESNPGATPEARAQIEKLGSEELASVILLVLATLFVLMTVLPTIGGLLGAKLMAPRSGTGTS